MNAFFQPPFSYIRMDLGFETLPYQAIEPTQHVLDLPPWMGILFCFMLSGGLFWLCLKYVSHMAPDQPHCLSVLPREGTGLLPLWHGRCARGHNCPVSPAGRDLLAVGGRCPLLKLTLLCPLCKRSAVSSSV